MMHPLLRQTAHRPWPLPARRWIWRQSWRDLAFIHYRVDSGLLRRRLPEGLRLEEFDGSAWVGLVPFRMSGVMLRPFPDLPGFSSFPELNLRTYVEADGKPGVWFFSLDADSWPIVYGGSRFYGVPYFHSRMNQEKFGGWFEYSCRRRDGTAGFRGRYRPIAAPFLPQRGSFEHWAAERYCVYSSLARDQLARTEVHHLPWPMQQAEVEIHESNILTAAGISTADEKPRCHFSTGVDVLTYPLEKMGHNSLRQGSGGGSALLLCLGLACISQGMSAGDRPADYKGTPFHDSVHQGGPQKIPGRVQCAYFDLGGEGVAYHTTDTRNQGSGMLNPANGSYLNEFRMNEAVGTSYTKFHDAIDDNPFSLVRPPEGQLYVGWTSPGEWFRMTVQVERAGVYAVDLLYTSNRGGRITLEVNGNAPPAAIDIISTKNAAETVPWRQWHHWNLMMDIADVFLPEGVSVLTVHIVSGGNMNLAYLDFEPKT